MLFIVLGIILVVVALTNAILALTVSQYRISSHNASRIQAYYAAMAGINYAIDKLRAANDTTNWPLNTSYSRTFCKSGCNVTEADFPAIISSVTVSVNNTDTTRRIINATVNYTYD